MSSAYPPRTDAPMPTDDDVARAELLLSRLSLLEDDCADVARDFLIAKAGDEKAAILGAADTSANPLSSTCRQLTTPGLYGRQPRISHRDPDAAPLLAQVALSTWLTKMPRVQYLAVGLGECLLRLDVPPDVGHVTVRVATPCDVYAECHPDLPDVPIVLWERRPRRHPADQKWRWFWDRYDLGERDAAGNWIRPPRYSVVLPKGGSECEDFSAYFLHAPVGGFVGVEGDGAYPFLVPGTTTPFLPWVVYRATDSGRMWNHNEKRGLTLGSLNTMVYATYAGHAALGATGRAVIAVGVDFGASVKEAPADQRQTARVRSIPLLPGSIVPAAPSGQGQPLVVEVGPGADLDVLQQFTGDYELKQSIRAGVGGADATRTAANPTSGAALAISDKGRREYADQVRPLFQRVDAEVIRKIAWLMRITGLGSPPADGYVIEYHSIPETPDEQRAKREARNESIERGELSPIDAFVAEHPGMSRDDAEAELVKITIDKKRLAKKITEAAIAEGLEEAAAPAADGGSMAPAQDVALNGAQIASLLLIVDQIALGKLARNGAIATLTTAFPSMSEEEAGRLFDGVNPTPVAPAPAPTATPAPSPPE